MSRYRVVLLLVVLVSLLTGTTRAQPPALDRHGDLLPPGTRARLGTVRFRHGGSVTFLAFAPDGKTLLSRSGGPLLQWETARGKLLRQFPGWAYGATSAAFSGDGKSLTLIGPDSSFRSYDPRTGKELRSQSAPKDSISRAALAPDGKTAALLDGNQCLRLWDVSAGRELHRLTAPLNPQAGQQNFAAHRLAFSPDGKLLAVAGTRGQDVIVRLWEVDSGRERPALIRPSGSLSCLTFSPDGKTLVIGEPGPAVLLLDLASGAKVRVAAELRGHPQAVAFAPDGKSLAVLNRPHVDLVDRATGQLLRRFTRAGQVFSCVAFSRDGMTLAAGGTGHLIHLWEVATGKELRPPEGPQGPITAVVYAPDGRTVATASEDQTVRLWDATTGKELRRLARPLGTATEGGALGPQLLAFLRNGRALAAAWPDGSVCVWETATGKHLSAGGNAMKGARPLAFAPGGRSLVVLGPDGLIRLRDVLSGREVRRFPGPPQAGQAGAGNILAAFGPDGRTLAISSGGQGYNPYLSSTARGWIDTAASAAQVRLWELTSGRERGQLSLGPTAPAMPVITDGLRGSTIWMDMNHLGTPVTLLALSPDGRTLAAAVGGTVRLYDLDSNRELRRLDNAYLGGGLAFSPNGRLLALGEGAGIALWDPATGECLGRVGGHRGPVSTLTFSPDGKALVSGSADTTALVWDVAWLRAEGRKQRVEPSPQRLEELWAELASADAARAYRAVWALAAAPARSVPFLGVRLKAVSAVDAATVRQLVASLGDARYGMRQRAVGELTTLGEIAEPDLREVLEGEPSLELRRRVEALLEKLEAPLTAPEALRALRAVEALERAGTKDARAALTRLAGGAAGARLTRDARAALERLDRRLAVAP